MIARGGWLLAAFAAACSDDLVLAPGGFIEADGPGPIVRYVADVDGKVTFALDSYEMDAYLIVRDANAVPTAEPVAQAEGGGIGQNARIVLELERGDELTIECTTRNTNNWPGKFRLSATAGDAPLPTGTDAKAIEARFNLAYAKRHLKLDDPATAAHQLRDAAINFKEAGLLDESASAAFECLDAAAALNRLDFVADAVQIALHAVDATTRVDAAEAILARLERACAAHHVAVAPARFAYAHATVAIRRGDFDAATTHLDAASADQSPGLENRVRLGIELARVLIEINRYRWPEAERRLTAASSVARDLGEVGMQAVCLHQRGMLRFLHSRRRDDGIADLECARELYRSIEAHEDDLMAAILLVDYRFARASRAAAGGAGTPQAREGAVARARATAIDDLRAIVDDSHSRRLPRAEARALVRLAEGHLEANELEEASRFAALAEALFRDSMGDARGILRARRVAAEVTLRRGDVSAAGAIVESALTAVIEGHARPLCADDAIGERALIEDWTRVAVDVAAARIGAGEDPAEEYVRIAPWRTTAVFEGRARDAIEQAARDLRAVALQPHEMLVDIVRGAHEAYVFSIRCEATRFARLGDAQRLEREIVELTELVRTRDSDRAAIVARARALYGTLLAPLALGADVERLVVADASLTQTVPVEVLIGSGVAASAPWSEQPFVVRTHEVVYATSWLSFVDATARPRSSAPFAALIVGDPSPTRLLPLPGARAEAIAVTESALRMLAEGDAPDSPFVGGATTFEAPRVHAYLGGDATRDRVLAQLCECTHLHFAAHATIDWADSPQSAVVLANDELLELGDVRATRLSAELTVLSACATSDGQVLRGNGVQSLATGFLRAGSRNVVASLFPVDDADAAEFQHAFYAALWERRLTPAAAVRAAKLALIQAGAARRSGDDRSDTPSRRSVTNHEADRAGHPNRWAAFVCFGPTR